MSFLNPEFIYYMLPPFLILFGLLLTQKESNAHFFSEEVMAKLRVSANTLTLRARNALFMLIGLFMILALAQPVIDDGTVEVKAKSADIMIALDISDSMLATDVYPNRLEMAKQKALTLLDESPNERIGIVAFAKNSYLVSPLSFDTSAVSFLLRQLDTTSITEKGTDLLGVLDVVSRAQQKQEKKYLLILSDGGDKSDFSDEIEMAKKNGITVFVLGVATKKGSPIKLEDGSFIKHGGEIIVSKLNENISKLATSTGGVYIQSTTSSNDIITMFREITNISEEKELRSEEVKRYIPLFYYPSGAALIILLIATSSMSKRASVNAPSAFLLFLLLFANQHAEAGVLDFMELNRAKKAYESGQFEESAKIYENYANATANGESYYNAGNAFYKQKKYKEAIESYKKATFESEEARAKNYSNMGNAYVREAQAESLQKAVESYEKSLKIKEDKDTRENLEEVKKLLQKQDPKDSDDKKDKRDSDKEDDSKEGDKKESDEKQQESSDKEEKSDKQENSSKSKESKETQNSSDDEMKSKKEKEESKERNTKEGEKDKIKEINRDKKEKSDAQQASQEPDEPKMSEAEEQKWIGQLNSGSNTYMYKLSDEKLNSFDADEKPW